MASGCSDDSAFDFPPLFQSMRLNIEGGPMYRGGRCGRAAAAYYREKELIIAIKNKYGNRFGRRIQAYKPDTEAWRPEHYQKRIEKLNCQNIPEMIPGGLQNKKPLIHIHHDWLAKKSTTADQQQESSRRNHIHDKYSSGTTKSEGVLATALRTSNTVNLAELGRPSHQGRGMMRGKRLVDVSAIFCADEKELAENSIINPPKREPESNIQDDHRYMINHGSNRSLSNLNKPDEKELTVTRLINPETREPEISIQKDKGNMKNCGGEQPLSQLITSDQKEDITVNCAINPEKRVPESTVQEDDGNVRSWGSDQSSSELTKLVGNLSIVKEVKKRRRRKRRK